ncbi:MAG TPA: type II toxin-antitoxin system RelE/ParE family toxin [Ramlibacter sp.]|nr:type II toxin-antitoxin system RelE/ParE family toxin [Ramlibacter sp.]
MLEIRQTPQYLEWIKSLRDALTRKRIEARVFRLAHGNPGDHRNLTDGVTEMRLDFGPGWRVYFTQRGNTLVVLLCGGDKSSQDRDIELALHLAKELE